MLGTDGQTKVRTCVAVKDADRVAVDGDSVAMEDRGRRLLEAITSSLFHIKKNICSIIATNQALLTMFITCHSVNSKINSLVSSTLEAEARELTVSRCD